MTILEEIQELEDEAVACRKLALQVDEAGAKDLKAYANELEDTARQLRTQLGPHGTDHHVRTAA